MTIRIVPYTREWEPAVKAFNQRLALKRTPVPFQFPERHVSLWLPPGEGRHVYQDYFLAIEDEHIVRGGYILKTQEFWVEGRIETVGNLQLPLSEGIVEPRFGFLGPQLVKDALKRRPLLFSLGMGGLENPYPRLLKGLKWSLHLVPFRFRVVRPARFLREIPVLRTSRAWRWALDLLAATGAGWLALKLAQGVYGRGATRAAPCDVEPQKAFGDWADEVWEASRDRYALMAVRDRNALDTLYSNNCFPGLMVLRMTGKQKNLGWVMVLDTPMSGHRQFGDLRVGSIVDALAAPDDALALVRGATRFLEARGVDLIVSNQTHQAWLEGLRACGYLAGPSNFALALSRAFAGKLPSCENRWGEFHFDRGDGDGPINL